MVHSTAKEADGAQDARLRDALTDHERRGEVRPSVREVDERGGHDEVHGKTTAASIITTAGENALDAAADKKEVSDRETEQRFEARIVAGELERAVLRPLARVKEKGKVVDDAGASVLCVVVLRALGAARATRGARSTGWTW